MHRARYLPLVAVVIVTAALSAQPPPTPAASGSMVLTATASQLSQLREADARVDRMLRAGDLALRSVRTDTLLSDRQHERHDQYVNGVRVFGADVARQLRDGVTESIFGEIQGPVAISTVPALSEDDARARFAVLAGGEFPAERPLELVVLPLDQGGHRLTWRSHVRTDEGWMQTFLDADTGAVVLQFNDLQTQAAVGTATGVLGDRKKISTKALAGGFAADDQLRPPTLITYDMHGNLSRTELFLEGWYRPSAADMARDSDNVWTDGANVDAHVYLGLTYDFYYKRFERRGLDDNDTPIVALSHPVSRSDLPFLPRSALDYVIGAFWCGGCGPDGRGVMVFGEGLPSGYILVSSGQYVDYLAAALDVVAHELTHGLTDYSSNLVYRNESGALNESFSDMLGTAAEYYYQATGGGLRDADYLIGEDAFRPGGIRSMENPGAFGDPDHYSHRSTGSADNGGVHRNSGIPNHAFYLAIEGGVNRTSGIRVTGVGGANREQIEKAFFRAFVSMLPSTATFRTARAATIQSARDLYGAGSAAERAITEAWTAVGVN